MGPKMFGPQGRGRTFSTPGQLSTDEANHFIFIVDSAPRRRIASYLQCAVDQAPIGPRWLASHSGGRLFFPCPKVAPSGHQMSGPTAPGPFEWLQDVQRRPQETIPTICGCKRAIFEKCLFSLGKTSICEGRWAKLRSEHPPFCGLKPPPRAIWTQGILGQHALGPSASHFAPNGMYGILRLPDVS